MVSVVACLVIKLEMMGILATLVVSPCTSAPLVGALTYINQTGNAFMGGIALFSLGLGMGVPLLVIGTTGGKYLPRTGPWMILIKKGLGLLLIAMAIWVLSLSLIHISEPTRPY